MKCLYYIFTAVVMLTPLFILGCVLVVWLAYGWIVGILTLVFVHFAVKRNGGWLLGWRRTDRLRFRKALIEQ